MVQFYRRALMASALFGALALAGSAQALEKNYTIGTEGAYPPFSEMGSDGKLKGFDIDIAAALCTRMKVTCTLVQAEFDAMIPALRAKKFDAIVASMSITPERKKSVDFSVKYYQTPARFVARADAKLDIAVQAIKNSRVVNSGQVCNCAERVYVDRRVADEFTEKLCGAMRETTFGDPLEQERVRQSGSDRLLSDEIGERLRSIFMM